VTQMSSLGRETEYIVPFLALHVDHCFKVVKVLSSLVTFESSSDGFWG
jgi:hypothetical protein